MRCGKTHGKSLHVEIETCKIVDVQMVAFHTNFVTLLLWKTRTFPSSLKQVTRGHNIVADGWAGAANPHPHPTPHPTPLPTQTHTQKASKTLIFTLFDSC